MLTVDAVMREVIKQQERAAQDGINFVRIGFLYVIQIGLPLLILFVLADLAENLHFIDG